MADTSLVQSVTPIIIPVLTTGAAQAATPHQGFVARPPVIPPMTGAPSCLGLFHDVPQQLGILHAARVNCQASFPLNIVATNCAPGMIAELMRAHGSKGDFIERFHALFPDVKLTWGTRFNTACRHLDGIMRETIVFANDLAGAPNRFSAPKDFGELHSSYQQAADFLRYVAGVAFAASASALPQNSKAVSIDEARFVDAMRRGEVQQATNAPVGSWLSRIATAQPVFTADTLSRYNRLIGGVGLASGVDATPLTPVTLRTAAAWQHRNDPPGLVPALIAHLEGEGGFENLRRLLRSVQDPPREFQPSSLESQVRRAAHDVTSSAQLRGKYFAHSESTELNFLSLVRRFVSLAARASFDTSPRAPVGIDAGDFVLACAILNRSNAGAIEFGDSLFRAIDPSGDRTTTTSRMKSALKLAAEQNASLSATIEDDYVRRFFNLPVLETAPPRDEGARRDGGYTRGSVVFGADPFVTPPAPSGSSSFRRAGTRRRGDVPLPTSWQKLLTNFGALMSSGVTSDRDRLIEMVEGMDTDSASWLIDFAREGGLSWSAFRGAGSKDVVRRFRTALREALIEMGRMERPAPRPVKPRRERIEGRLPPEPNWQPPDDGPVWRRTRR